VVAAVNRLKPKDREIVKLYAWEDLPRDIIAEMMGMTRAAIDQFEFRAVGLDGELG
jgi:DNA-directed RNA polymerase specialized sigma24 family protein